MSSNSKTNAAPEDRRHALRQSSREAIFNLKTDDGNVSHIKIEDVSRTGLRFACTENLRNGEVVTIIPPSNFGLEPCKATIARIQVVMEDQDQSSFAYGAELYEAGDARHAWFLQLRAA